VILARKVLRRRSVPVAATPATPGRHEWEYVPEGWSAQQKDPLIKGWNIGSILDSYKKNWPVFLANIQGPGPLGISPESSSAQRDNVILHNIMMTYAYVLSRAARKKDTLSLLDWGGSIGHYYLLARTLAPDVVIDYHCKDLPVLVEHGRTLSPDLHFHADESCLERTYDLVLACSSLHYSPDWRSTLRKLGAATAGHLFITGLPTVRDAASFVYVQRPYHYGYDTEYLGWCLNRDEFLAAAQSAGLQLLREFVVGHKPMIHNAPEQNEFFGFLFQASTAGTQT